MIKLNSRVASLLLRKEATREELEQLTEDMNLIWQMTNPNNPNKPSLEEQERIHQIYGKNLTSDSIDFESLRRKAIPEYLWRGTSEAYSELEEYIGPFSGNDISFSNHVLKPKQYYLDIIDSDYSTNDNMGITVAIAIQHSEESGSLPVVVEIHVDESLRMHPDLVFVDNYFGLENCENHTQNITIYPLNFPET